jgi:hypothetical protein
MTPIRRVLVVAKKTTYRRFVVESKDARIADLLERGDVSVRKLRKSHVDHEAAITEVMGALEALGVPHERVETRALARATGRSSGLRTSSARVCRSSASTALRGIRSASFVTERRARRRGPSATPSKAASPAPTSRA